MTLRLGRQDIRQINDLPMVQSPALNQVVSLDDDREEAKELHVDIDHPDQENPSLDNHELRGIQEAMGEDGNHNFDIQAQIAIMQDIERRNSLNREE